MFTNRISRFYARYNEAITNEAILVFS